MLLLAHLGTRTLVLAGLTANRCVLWTASDAYMRDLRLVVPSGCVASVDPRDGRRSLEHMYRILKADTRRAAEIDLEVLRAR
jgi:nicotinamidase-related amidase